MTPYIRQFYATYEMDFDAKNIKWMTEKGEYKATFAEFGAANYLDYDFLVMVSMSIMKIFLRALLYFMSLVPQMQL
jgi:hypothetical protein